MMKKPPNKLTAVIAMVQTVLKAPQADDAVEPQIADQYKTNKKEFEKIAKDWVKKYASK
jgi:ubiquitin-protein ligase